MLGYQTKKKTVACSTDFHNMIVIEGHAIANGVHED